MRRRNMNGVKERDGIYYDAVEDTEEYKAVVKEADRLARKEIGERFGLGYCHSFWPVKKRILREKFGIEWASPAELNPHIRFD